MKRIMFGLFAILFFSCFAGAIETNMADSYKQKETAIVLIEGSVTQQIQPSQIKLQRGNSYVAFEYGTRNIDGKYYVWLVTPNSAGSYKLIIENVQTIENGQAVESDYEKEFSVTNETEEYYVKPGTIISSSDFYITAVNNKNFDIPINSDSGDITLKPGESNIKFEIENFQGTQTVELNIGKYKIPSKIYGIGEANTSEGNNNLSESNGNVTNSQNSSSNHTTNETINASFEFGAAIIRTKVTNTSIGQKIKFEIKNNDFDDLENWRFIYDENYFEIEDPVLIKKGESKEFDIELLKIPDKDFRDAIIVEHEGKQKYFIIILENTPEAGNISVEYVDEENSKSFYYCTELGGKICTAGESCSESEIDSLDGKCCLMECSTESSSGGSSWIGYIIALIVIILIIYVFMNYKKTKPNGENAVKSKFISAEKNLP